MNPPAYRVKCLTNDNLIERMDFLFKHKMSFTHRRIRTIDETRRQYYDIKDWYYILLCHNEECQRIFNTSALSGCTFFGSHGAIIFTTIAWDDFVRDVLPTL